jgi:hypothetical protein
MKWSFDEGDERTTRATEPHHVLRIIEDESGFP